MSTGRFSLIVAVGAWLLATLLLSACRPGSEDGDHGPSQASSQKYDRTLYYFTWSDYVDQQLLDGFKERAGVNVVADTFSSNEELLAKLQSGAGGYDVAVPSDFMVSIMARQGLLATLDTKKIPNSKLLSTRLQTLPVDPDHRYSMPYFWGTVGIAYDSDVIDSAPDSWEILWDPRYKGRISMLNDQREVFGVALRTLGYSLNETAPPIIEKAKHKLLAQKPLVKAYTSENYDHLLSAGEVVLAHGWGGAVARAMEERSSLKYVVPQEGGTVWADCLVVLESSEQKDLAMEFINYLLDTEVAIRTTTRLRFASANGEVRARLAPHLRENPAIYPRDETFDRLEWMVDVGEAIHLYDRAWTELKMK